MSEFNFQLFVQGNQRTGKIEAAYFQVRKGRVAETVEVIEGTAFVDYGKGGKLLGVELLAPCRVTALDRIVRGEPKEVKGFLRGGIPRDLAVA